MPFRLDIVETGEQWVVTCATPHGKAVSRIPAPFSPDVLHRALADIEKALIRSYSPVTTRRAAPADRVVREFGEILSDAVLAGDVRRLFDRCRQDARERQTPLRIVLDTDGPNVSSIPWEFTIDPNARDEYLALRVPIIRSPHLIGQVSSSRVALPLRVLGVSARPADLPALDTQREREDISKAFWQRLTPGNVHIEWLHEDRWAELAEAIRSHPWHVLHIMSHGGFDPEAGGGYVQLSGEDGTARPVSAVDLARLISENPSLRLIVLNACESAFSSAEGIFTSTAEKLVREGGSAAPQYSPGYQQPAPPYPQAPYPGAMAPPIQTYLVPAILVTLFCFLPTGIAAIVYSTQVSSKRDAGDYIGAARASKQARMWTLVSLAAGVAVLAIVVIAAAASSGGSSYG